MEVEVYIRTKDQLLEIFNHYFSSVDYVRHYRKEIDPKAYRSPFKRRILPSLGLSVIGVPSAMIAFSDFGNPIVVGIAGLAVSCGVGLFVSPATPTKELESEMLTFMGTTENKFFLSKFDAVGVKLFRQAYESYVSKNSFITENHLFSTIDVFSYNRTETNELIYAGRGLIGDSRSEVLKKPQNTEIIEEAPKTQGSEALSIKTDSLQKIVDGISSERFKMEMDIVEVLNNTVIFDMSFPATKEFMILMNKTNIYKPSSDTVLADSLFAKTVYELEFSWAFLKNESNRIRLSNFSEDERQRVERARKLISIALDKTVTPHERQTAYKRVIKELEGIIVVPAKAMVQLEAKTGLLSLEGQAH